MDDPLSLPPVADEVLQAEMRKAFWEAQQEIDAMAQRARFDRRVSDEMLNQRFAEWCRQLGVKPFPLIIGSK